jgi:hypothetical protein
MEKEEEFIGKSKQFNEKINAIKSQFFSALGDFKKYYIYYNKNPEVDEFENYYANSKSQLKTMTKDLLSTTNHIDKSIEDLNKSMLGLTIQLEKEKKINEEMTKKMVHLETTENGSEILIDDSKEKYNIQYYKNIQLVVGIIIICILLVKLFKNSPLLIPILIVTPIMLIICIIALNK